MSDDLTTLSVIPVPEWPKGQELKFPFVYWYRFTDLTGAETKSQISTHFLVAFDAKTTRPQLTSLFPADGMIGLPMNPTIVATFDQPVLGTSTGKVRLYEGLTPIPLNVFQDNLTTLRFVPTIPLRPLYHYTLTVDGITDASGNVMTGPVTRTFMTGAQLDFTNFTAVIYPPLVRSATPVPIRVVFNKPVDPSSVGPYTLPFTKASAIASSYDWILSKAAYTVSDDGMTVIITPQDPLIPGWPYQVLVGNVRDYAGNPASSFYSIGYPSEVFQGPTTMKVGAPVATVVPSDGSLKVPLNTRLAVVFDRQFLPQAPESIFHLSRDEKPVTGKTSLSGNDITFVPDAPLAAGATYRIDVTNVGDADGNLSSPASATFTTTDVPLPPFQQLTFVSSTPANGDAGVPVDAPLILRFSAAVDPTTVQRIFFQSSVSTTGAYTTAGDTVTFRPANGWPGAQNVQLNFNNNSSGTVTDLAGNLLSGYNFPIAFKTAPAPVDATPPQFLSISPESGTLLNQPSQFFMVNFSKPVTFGATGLSISYGSQKLGYGPTSYPGDDPNTVAFSLLPPSNSQVTLSSTSSIVDRSGNPLTNPFTAQYPTAAIGSGDRPAVQSVTPTTYQNPTPTTPIVIYFNKMMDTSTLATSIRITQDGDSITGSLDFLDSNRTARFTADQPYKIGSRIDIFVLETAADVFGGTLYQRYNSSFNVATAPAATVSILQTSFGQVVAPADAALDLRFNQELDPLTVNGGSIWLRAGRRLVAGAVELRDTRTVRFIPSQPLELGVPHALTISSNLRSTSGSPADAVELPFETGDPGPPAEIETVEWSTYSGQPAVHVKFTAVLDPLSLDTVRLNVGAARYIAHSLQEIWLVPRTMPKEKILVEVPALSVRREIRQ